MEENKYLKGFCLYLKLKFYRHYLDKALVGKGILQKQIWLLVTDEIIWLADKFFIFF